MSSLVCFGYGYSAAHYVAAFGKGFDRIVGTVRKPQRAVTLNATLPPNVRIEVFDGSTLTPELAAAVGRANFLLISAPPGAAGDPVLAVAAEALSRASELQAVAYLSTIGVYGDHQGGYVDETTPPQPNAGRSRDRLAAEAAWLDFGARRGVAVGVLRLAGIYGPGQNALLSVQSGTARRVVKPGQVFNRIHVGDIAQAIEAVFRRRASGVFNVVDDEPSPPADPIIYAARLLHREPPPEVAFEEAAKAMTPLGLSFWQECRRARNDRLKRELGVTLSYPTYREGLDALLRDGFA
jgi:nucleoside-diphosphate-sugar epimerase